MGGTTDRERLQLVMTLLGDGCARLHQRYGNILDSPQLGNHVFFQVLNFGSARVQYPNVLLAPASCAI